MTDSRPGASLSGVADNSLGLSEFLNHALPIFEGASFSIWLSIKHLAATADCEMHEGCVTAA